VSDEAQISARQWLVKELDQLVRQNGELEAELRLLERIPDVPALRSFRERLACHQQRLGAYCAALEAYHSRYGPVRDWTAEGD
jgi:hypothetical protein